MQNALRKRWTASVVGMLLLFAGYAHATSVIPLYLDELIDQSTVAFEGTCTDNRTERDPVTNFVVTYTTFAVSDVLKGAAGAAYTIKQIGSSLPGEAVPFRIQGVPRFAVGESYVVFLAGVSDAGFSSPIGLSQGRFTVSGAAGTRKVRNGRDFKDMTAHMPQGVPQRARDDMKSAQGPSMEMDLDDFKQAVRAHVGAKK